MAEQPGRPQQPVPPEKDSRKAEEPKKGPAAEKSAEKGGPSEIVSPFGKGTDTVRVRIVGDVRGEADLIGKRVELLEKASEKFEEIEKRVVEKADEKIHALEKRVAELERLKNRGKWVAGSAVVAVASAVLALVYVASIPAAPPPAKNLDLEGLIVRDPGHRFKMEIGQAGPDSFGLFLTDEKSVGSDPAKQIPRIEMRTNEKGENRLIIRASGKRQSAVDLGVNTLGWPCVTVFDKETGVRRADLGETEVPAQGKLEKCSAASVVLRDTQGNLLWKEGQPASDFAPVTPPPQPAK